MSITLISSLRFFLVVNNYRQMKYYSMYGGHSKGVDDRFLVLPITLKFCTFYMRALFHNPSLNQFVGEDGITTIIQASVIMLIPIAIYI